MIEFKESPNLEGKTPDLEDLKQRVHNQTILDILVKKSIGDGYMTEEELLIGRWVTKYLDLNAPNFDAPASGENRKKKREIWLQKLPEATREAAKQFNIKPEEAEKLFKKSLDIRARNIKK